LQPGCGVVILSYRGSSSLNAPGLAVLRQAMASRDISTHEHAERVQRYAMALARHAGIGDPDVLDALEQAAILHDLGKLAIPDRLLDKPGPLTKEEYAQVKHHAAIGADMLIGMGADGLLASFVRHHHEAWDGTGYPDGLKQTDIPLGARALSIADCYDALTSPRPYRRALAHDTATAMIYEARGTSFDPRLTDAFLRIVWRLRPSSPPLHVVSRPRTRLRGVASREASAR
jgi:putative nucleotidyltransferase with HDIG domain